MPRKPPSAEQLRRREQVAFARRIRTVFTNAGFAYLPTAGIERQFGDKTGELDQVFVFDNVILVCEDTLAQSPREHLKNKKLLFEQIDAHREEFIQWIKKDFADRLSVFDDYDAARYKVFYLYFSKQDFVLNERDIELFKPVRVVRPSTLGYFQKMAQNVKRSARTDIFRFLGIRSSDVGSPDAGSSDKKITTTIIYPPDSTGLRNGVRIVSFMMSAEMLLKNCYVLRKDNWEESIGLYQRLIERDRIQSIRRYLAEKQNTFINNIIVSLPAGVEFRDAGGRAAELSEIQSFHGYQMRIPDEMNTICVIDGQHRIFAHYEGVDALEFEIKQLRKKFHLLVTGLIFPDDMSDLEQRKFESELFLDINSNARPVPADVLLFIEMLKDPFSSLGVARQVLARLNQIAPFENRFQLSLMDEGKIKIASIIKFALRYLVEIVDDPARPTLFAHWATPEDRAGLLRDRDEKKSAELLERYVNDVAGTLAQYFSALKSNRATEWEDPESRVLSTTSINGFLLALRRSLPSHGVLTFEQYRDKFTALSTDFSKERFSYTSSQYAKYSRLILSEVFEVTD